MVFLTIREDEIIVRVKTSPTPNSPLVNVRFSAIALGQQANMRFPTLTQTTRGGFAYSQNVNDILPLRHWKNKHHGNKILISHCRVKK